MGVRMAFPRMGCSVHRAALLRHGVCTDDGMTANIRSAPKERICPECGGVVADSDPVCPHCGATLVGG
jgi:rubrerythrin